MSTACARPHAHISILLVKKLVKYLIGDWWRFLTPNFYAAQRLVVAHHVYSRFPLFSPRAEDDDATTVSQRFLVGVFFSRSHRANDEEDARENLLDDEKPQRCSRDTQHHGRHLRHRFGHDEQRRRHRHGVWDN